MKLLHLTAAALLLGLNLSAQTATNLGLVGVGRLSGNSFDQLGPNIDSLGGIGSGIYFAPESWARVGDENNGYTYGGTLYAVPDRGFGGGRTDYRPRLQTFSLAITPYYGTAPVPQNQIALSNTATLLFTYDTTNVFTGADADNLAQTNYPASAPGSVGGGRRSLDPEGLSRAPDGGWFVCDEYGPFLYKFDAAGNLEYTMQPPTALIPKRGAFPGLTAFTGTNTPTSGRHENRGLEGLSVTPDGKRLFTALQSAPIQDGGAGNLGRHTRVLVFDIDPLSVTYRQPVGEYIYRITLNGSAQTNRNTPLSEILALNRTQFLVIERDNLGLGSGTNTPPSYKRVVLGDLSTATNIINTGYDLELGAPFQTSVPGATLPVGVSAINRTDLIDLIDTNQLGKFGLTANTNVTTNSMTEKWEGLALLPMGDPAATNDFLLVVANDNDFSSPVVYHSGLIVGTNDIAIDNLFLAYRITLPNFGTAVPANKLPSVAFTGPTNATLSAPALVNLATTAYDQDGKVVKVEFYEDAVKIGEDTTFPFSLSLSNVAAGNHNYSAVATDNDGATTTVLKTVVVTANNILPSATIAGPTNATLSAPALVALTATASDPDGFVTKVEFFDGGTKIGQDTTAPYSLTVSNVGVGTHSYTSVATDNQGATTTSSAWVVNVTTENIAPSVTLLTPTNNFTATQTVNIAFSATASDPDGFITKVEYYRGATKLGQATAAPYSFTASNFVAGTNLVHALAYDNQGATTASADATVIVFDRTAPVIRCSSNLLVSCTSTSGTPVNFTVTATDNNDTNVTVVCNPSSGSLFSPGTNVVFCMATDAAGNTSSCSFNVIILPSLVTIERAIILRWNCGEVLQSADNATGPWLDIPGATSPYVVPSSEARRFYRVRN